MNFWHTCVIIVRIKIHFAQMLFRNVSVVWLPDTEQNRSFFVDLIFFQDFKSMRARFPGVRRSCYRSAKRHIIARPVGRPNFFSRSSRYDEQKKRGVRVVTNATHAEASLTARKRHARRGGIDPRRRRRRCRWNTTFLPRSLISNDKRIRPHF